MRLVINGPPKQGHRWLKCLLADVYDLSILGGRKTPGSRPRAITDWIASGGFPDDAIFHQHAKFTPRRADALEQAPAQLLTVVRDPYDTFVSLYYWVQDRTAHGEFNRKDDKVRPRDDLRGKPLDHPEVLAFLRDDFGSGLARANGWLHSGRALPIRYEDIHRDAVATLRTVTDRLAPITEPDRIERAVATCHADAMRERNEKFARHVRSATVGDSRQRLGDAHLAIFRERHGELIRSLGYEVR